MIANLVQNALRYAPAGSGGRITGSARRDAVELRVVDRGPGIAPADADAVFAAFQRRDDAPAEAPGSGWGWPSPAGSPRRWAAAVSAEETPGGGATLVVRLAVAPAEGRTGR